MRLAIVLLCACSAHHAAPDSVDPDALATDATAADAPISSERWQPVPGTTWQWQLQGTIDTTVDAQMFDVDLFETPQAVIDELHTKQRKVVCYFDTAYEPGRPDSAQLEPYRGDPIDGWPGQFWLDIRVPAVQAVMVARIAMAQAKHCDAIEPDDVDVTTNDTALHITPAQQLAFIQLLGTEGHNRGLAVALKNDLDQVPDLVDTLDFAVNEECFRYTECDGLAPWIAKTKAVFQTEYTAGNLATLGATICPQAHALHFDTNIKHLDLGVERYACP